MSPCLASSPSYVLATGAAAVRRLHVLHDIYSPVGRRVLLQAGLKQGMKVADFGCGVGVVTRMLAKMAGPRGHVTGIDVDRAQLEQASDLCMRERLAKHWTGPITVIEDAVEFGPERFVKSPLVGVRIGGCIGHRN